MSALSEAALLRRLGRSEPFLGGKPIYPKVLAYFQLKRNVYTVLVFHAFWNASGAHDQPEWSGYLWKNMLHPPCLSSLNSEQKVRKPHAAFARHRDLCQTLAH